MKRIALFGSHHQGEQKKVLEQLFHCLSVKDVELLIEQSFFLFLKEQLNIAPKVKEIIDSDNFCADVVLSIGGDGTFLRTSAKVGRKQIPILGINTGRLGFLADVTPKELKLALELLFSEDYTIEERTLLSVSSNVDFKQPYSFALNEFAVLKQDTSSMISIHTYLDNQYLTTYEADGLIVATPTGSTAYSMSVNGPILIPSNQNWVLSPVAPHNLTVRPLVVPDHYILDLEVESRTDSFLIAFDGRSEVVPSHTKLTLKKADFYTRIIKLSGHSFIQTLREKLMWGTMIRK